MHIDKTTCWYNRNKSPEMMLSGAKGILWPKLEYSDHIGVLKNLLDKIPTTEKSLLDVGCGAAELSRVFPEYFYFGADLENTIKDVSMVMHPDANFIIFDVYESPQSCNFIAEYDIVVMNAFIDVMQYPIKALENILMNAKKYVIIHRQEVDNNGSTRVVTNPSYGGFTYHSIINCNEFNKILEKYNFKILSTQDLYNNSKSFLLKVTT